MSGAIRQEILRESLQKTAQIHRQAERIRQLEAELEAVGAGGVNGPLLGRASTRKPYEGLPKPKPHTINIDALNALVAADEALQACEMKQDGETNSMVDGARVLIAAALAGVPVVQPVAPNGSASQPAAPQGVAYAELPEPFLRTAQGVAFSGRQLYDFADRTHALRASNGQAPAGATDDRDQKCFCFGSMCEHCAPKRPTAQAAPAADYDHGPQSINIEEAARHVGKWLNERPNRPLDLRDVAMLVAHAQAPAAGAVAGPVETIKFSDGSTADPVEKARRYLKAMADHRINSKYFFDDGWPKKESASDAMATLVVLEQLAAAPIPAAQADSVLEDAARWQMAVLVGNQVMLHPENRTHPAAVKAYMDAVHSGLDLTGAVDAARKQG